MISSVGGWLLGMRNMMVSTLGRGLRRHGRGQGPAPTASCALRGPQRGAAAVAGFAISLGFVVSRLDRDRAGLLLPGHRRQLLQASQNNDYALMQGIFLVITLAVLGANFAGGPALRLHRPAHRAAER